MVCFLGFCRHRGQIVNLDSVYDGRAIYLGELDRVDGASLDIQLKGSGRTRYSRNGDGRSALGPVLREYLVSETMQQLHVPTTRALAAVLSGEQVVRERLIAGAVMTRVASRDTETVINALIKHARKLPTELYKSLTWDRGKEMADHQRFTLATDIDVYFCDPQSP